METELLQEIRDGINAINASNRLWDYADIADYMNISEKTVQNRIKRAIENEGFPRARETLAGKRWIPAEVKAWTEKRRSV